MRYTGAEPRKASLVGARYDASDGLYWLSVRAYDPSIGRFLSRDPLGRAPLFFNDNPYVYAGNNPLSNVDPSGQYRAAGHGADVQAEDWNATKQAFGHITSQSGCDERCQVEREQEAQAGSMRDAQEAQAARLANAKGVASNAAAYFGAQARTGFGFAAPQFAGLLTVTKGTSMFGDLLKVLGLWIGNASFFTLLWATENVAVMTYDVVALVSYAFFNHQSMQSDAYWSSSGSIASDWGGASQWAWPSLER